MVNQNLQFLLNDRLVTLSDFDPNLTVLQYLRSEESLTGTKEGCGSGDCGACTVVVADIDATNKNTLTYKSINACITFLGNVHGKQLITVEHLKQKSALTETTDKSTIQCRSIHPIQSAMVEQHASQCGFCTPGIVMSSFALHKNNSNPNRNEVIEALAGNLCRCTGYRSIIDAITRSTKEQAEDSFFLGTEQTLSQLKKIRNNASLECHSKHKSYFAPTTIQALSRHLLKHPDSRLLSGGTDLALSVTQNLDQINQLTYLGNVTALKVVKENAEEIVIGAAATYSECKNVLENNFPELGAMIERIGSMQIRNTGTLGGNIGNASPIGDMPPVLMALETSIILQLGDDNRKLLLDEFFTGYKQTVLQPSEFIREIVIPKTFDHRTLKVYKISKRFDDDISAVLVALSIELKDNKISHVKIAFGGMAAVPKRAKYCELALLNKHFSQESIDNAKDALENDFSPMSDVRASAEYRVKVAQNIIQRFYLEMLDDVKSVTKSSSKRVADYA